LTNREVRNQTLEEAAKMVEKLAESREWRTKSALIFAADQIRILKSLDKNSKS
jgi:hypothetical protein